MILRKRGSFGVKWGVCRVSTVEGGTTGRERERERGREGRRERGREGGRERGREGRKESEREEGREGRGREDLYGTVRYCTRYGRYRVP